MVHPPQRGPTWLRSPGIGRRHASTAWSKWHLNRTMPVSASPASHQGTWMALQGSRMDRPETSLPSFLFFTGCTVSFPVLGTVLRSVFGGTAGPGERTEGGQCAYAHPRPEGVNPRQALPRAMRASTVVRGGRTHEITQKFGIERRVGSLATA